MVSYPTINALCQRHAYVGAWQLPPKAQEFAPDLAPGLVHVMQRPAASVPAALTEKSTYSDLGRSVVRSGADRLSEYENTRDPVRREELQISIFNSYWQRRELAEARKWARELEDEASRSQLLALADFGEAMQAMSEGDEQEPQRAEVSGEDPWGRRMKLLEPCEDARDWSIEFRPEGFREYVYAGRMPRSIWLRGRSIPQLDLVSAIRKFSRAPERAEAILLRLEDEKHLSRALPALAAADLDGGGRGNSPLQRRSLPTTDLIESCLATVRDVARNVKGWQGGDHIVGWTAAAVLEAEKKFRKVKGYRELKELGEKLS